MRLTNITAKNIKGNSFSCDLNAANIIHGRNMTGKTTILDAVKLALLGEHDELGKQGKGLRELSSDKEMTIEGTFDDGKTATFELTHHGQSAKINRTGYEGDVALRMNLCPKEFFSKKDTDKIKTLLEMCGDTGKVTKDYIASAIRRVRIKGMTTEGENSDLADIEDFAEQAETEIEDGDIETLQDFEKSISEERTERGRAVKALKPQVEDDQYSETPDHPATNTTELKEKQAILNNAIIELNKEISDLENTKIRLQTLLRKKAREEQEAETEDGNTATPAPEVNFDATKVQNRIQAINTEMYALRDEANGLSIKLNESKVKESALKNEVQQHQQSMQQGQWTPISQEQPPAGTKVSISCEAVYMGQQQGVIPMQETIQWLKEAAQENTPATSEEALDGIADTIEELTLSIQTNEGKYNALITEQTQLNKDLQEYYAMQQQKSQSNTAYQMPPEEKEELAGMEDESFYNDEIQGKYFALGEIKDELKEFSTQIEEAAKTEGIMQRQKELNEKLSLAERRQETVKHVLKAVRDLQEEIVNNAITGVLEIVNAITLDIVDEVEWDGNLCKKDGKNTVSYKTFSGCEKAVTQMALSVALADRSEYKLAILDEFMNIDQGYRETLINNLDKAVEDGIIDQYIAFSHEEPPVHGINVNELPSD